MTPATASLTVRRSDFLRRALQADGLVSGLSGAALILAPGPIGAFLGWHAPLALAGGGGALLLYAAGLFLSAARDPVDRRGAWLAVVLNALWVAGSVFVLLAGWPPGLTSAGKWAVLLVADTVATFALLEVYGLRRQ